MPGDAEPLAYLGKGIGPRFEGGAGWKRAIVALGDDGILDLLDPPAWLYDAVVEVLESKRGGIHIKYSDRRKPCVIS
ncbi:hypothetical protein IMZ48_06305 [Candidatus Bathyarchaeota archaeon]|nr:hypothetical protein [Candidatus Bathyarchaeota archaeon]